MKPLFLNLHQPKAGGKTIESALQVKLRDKLVRVSSEFRDISVGNVKDYEEAFAARRGRYEHARIVTGHFYFGLHRSFERPCVYGTVLRDPVSRLKSYYNYAMNGGPDYFLFRYLTENDISFDDFVRFGDTIHPDEYPLEFTYTVSNGQARLVNGTPAALDHDMTPAEYNTALDNIAQHFAFIATTRDIPAYVNRMLLYVGTTPAWLLPRANASERDWVGEISPATRDYIRSRNGYDIKLCEHAQAVWRSLPANGLYSTLGACGESAGRLYTLTKGKRG